MSLGDMFRSAATAMAPHRIHYMLPDGVDIRHAPSTLNIDGYATLRAEKVRITPEGQYQALVDETVRHPMIVAPVGANHPAVRAEAAKPGWAALTAVLVGASLLTYGCLTAAVNPVGAGISIAVGLLLIFAGFALGTAGPEQAAERAEPLPA